MINLDSFYKKVIEYKPLVHNITNYVTANDCANILLAAGASPIMADDANEVEEITSICNGLNINIGTLNSRTIQSMILAGKKANLLKHPVVLDPVGIGASSLRRETSKALVEEISFDVIKGNLSEIKVLAQLLGDEVLQSDGNELLNSKSRGVDSSEFVEKGKIGSIANFAQKVAKKFECIIVITGEIDIVANCDHYYLINNGHKMMSEITGSGCMLSSLIAGFISANQDKKLEATASAVSLLAIAGEKAYEKMIKLDAGNSSYRNYLIDEIFKIRTISVNEQVKAEFE